MFLNKILFNFFFNYYNNIANFATLYKEEVAHSNINSIHRKIRNQAILTKTLTFSGSQKNLYYTIAQTTIVVIVYVWSQNNKRFFPPNVPFKNNNNHHFTFAWKNCAKFPQKKFYFHFHAYFLLSQKLFPVNNAEFTNL